MTSSSQRGKASESAAADFLTKQGLHCIARNFRCRRGEIDLIFLSPDHTLIIVEVRQRSKTRYASAAESITWQKQQRIIHATRYFLVSHPRYQDCNLRFDVVLFDQQEPTPQWICSAFDASSAY
jgi:putative endonuclease